MTRVYVRHVRAAGFCIPGLRIWCKERGFSFKDFIRNGIEAEKLVVLNDAMASKAVELAEREDSGR